MADETRWREKRTRMGNWDFIRAKIDLYYGLEHMAQMDLTSRAFGTQLELFLTFWNSGSPR